MPLFIPQAVTTNLQADHNDGDDDDDDEKKTRLKTAFIETTLQYACAVLTRNLLCTEHLMRDRLTSILLVT